MSSTVAVRVENLTKIYPNGVVGLETTAGVVLDLVARKKLPLDRAIEGAADKLQRSLAHGLERLRSHD